MPVTIKNMRGFSFKKYYGNVMIFFKGRNKLWIRRQFSGVKKDTTPLIII